VLDTKLVYDTPCSFVRQETTMESSMEIVMGDNGLLSLILTHGCRSRRIGTRRPWSAKPGTTRSTWAAHELTIRSTTLLPSLLPRFKHVKHLNFSQCCDQLQDSDLQLISECLKSLLVLSLGNPDEPQECISNLGF
jgi:hypothetical protein